MRRSAAICGEVRHASPSGPLRASADTRSLPKLAYKEHQELRGLATFDDRIVLATGGYGTTTLWILDEKGGLLTSHPCHGGPINPGDVALSRVGDSVVASNLLPPGRWRADLRGTPARSAAVA